MGVRGVRAAAAARADTIGTELRSRWVAVLLAALLAFSWQSFVTQTHVHPGTYSAAVGAATRATSGQPGSDLPANCPICQEIAHAGHYLLPAPVAFHAPDPAAAVAPAVAPSRAPAPGLRSHAWRSRAPPHALQA